MRRARFHPCPCSLSLLLSSRNSSTDLLCLGGVGEGLGVVCTMSSRVYITLNHFCHALRIPVRSGIGPSIVDEMVIF